MNCPLESMNLFNLVHNSSLIYFFTNPESIFESSSHHNSLPNPPFLCSTERKIIFGWTITLTTLVTYFVQSTWTISKNMFHWNIQSETPWRIARAVMTYPEAVTVQRAQKKHSWTPMWHCLSFKTGIFPLEFSYLKLHCTSLERLIQLYKRKKVWNVVRRSAGHGRGLNWWLQRGSVLGLAHFQTRDTWSRPCCSTGVRKSFLIGLCCWNRMPFGSQVWDLYFYLDGTQKHMLYPWKIVLH